MKEIAGKHLISISILCAEVMGIVGAPFVSGNMNIANLIFEGLFYGIFFMYPVVLTFLNLFFLLKKSVNEQLLKRGRHIEYLTLALGSIYSLLAWPFSYITLSDWTEVLENQQLHTPIWTEGVIAVVVLSVVGMTGYLFLSCIHIGKVPPLVSVCAIAAMYLGILMCILWVVQLFGKNMFCTLLCLFPFNCVILAAKLIRFKIMEWKADHTEERKTFRNPYLNRMNQTLMKAERWPLAAFLMMWPLLGIVLVVLVLFGQQPDSVIKAWTQTSDWNLSQQVAPPNVYYDEHYLCTVAAGGHRKIVKPLRMGERHGHKVVVNRQLCIANAFEQILEEKVPSFHRRVRNFYDKYGFPVAKLIHSPYLADVIYFVMKPLEWIFLVVIYFCDVNPENRIAVQYLPGRKCERI